MNEGINLLDPNKKNSPVFVHHLQITRIIVIGLLFVVSVSSVIVFILVALSPLPALQEREQSLQQNLSLAKTDIIKLQLIKERTRTISQFLNTRQIFDQTLSVIQSKLPSSTEVTEITADDKSITITVESASLQDLDNFFNDLASLVQAKKNFSQAILVSLTNDAANNKYAATIKLSYL